MKIIDEIQGLSFRIYMKLKKNFIKNKKSLKQGFN